MNLLKTKTKLTIIFLTFTLFSFNIQAKEFNNFYYAFKDKIEFTVIPNKIIVKKNVDIKTSDYEMLLKHLLGNVKIEWHTSSICQVDLKTDDYIVDEIIKTILSMNETVSVRKMNRLNEEFEFGFTNEIVIKFLEDVDNSEKDEILKKLNLQKIKSTVIYEICTVEKNADVLEVANRLFETGMFEFAYPGMIYKVKLAAYYPNDPYFKYQVALHNTGQVLNDIDGNSGTYDADIDAPEAWAITKGSSNIVIAVLDQGVTSNHPDLPNTRQVRLPGSNFSYANPNDPIRNDPSPVGNDNHGNATAGIIAATMDNGEGIAGIAPHCKIMPIRSVGGVTSVLPTYQQKADGIKFAADNGANIITNGWVIGNASPNGDPGIISAIQYAINKGVVVIFPAGNEANHFAGNTGFVCFPANTSISGLITVGASDRYDKQANYSPTSSLIDIVAPSSRARDGTMPNEISEMWSLDIPGVDGENPRKRIIPPNLLGEVLPAANSGPNHLAYTGRFGGTSFAAPVVAGVAALVLSINPQLTPHQVKNILTETADKVGGYTYINGRSNEMGYGRVNAHKAVRRARCMRSDTPNSDNVTGIITGTRIARARNITVQNATVQNGARLELEVCNGSITINAGFKIEPSGRFIIW